MNPRLMLFDFDGTLADSFDETVAAANRLASEFGYDPFDERAFARLKERGARQLLRDSGIPLRRIPSWIRRMRGEVRRSIVRILPPPGVDDALRALTKTNVTLGIVTSNSRESVDLFLRIRGWQDRFEHIACGSTLFGKSRLILRLLKNSGAAPTETCYVGDEVRDIEAARRAGVISVAVTWGFNTRKLLADVRPDHLIDTPGELLTFANRPSSRGLSHAPRKGTPTQGSLNRSKKRSSN